MKVTLSEIKKKLQGANREVDEAKNQINDLKHKEEKGKIISEQQEERRIQKNKDRPRSLWDNLKHTNILIIGVQKEK